MSAAPALLWVNHFAAGPGQGGGTRHIEMARVLKELGWRVTIAASDFDLHTRRYARRAGKSDRRAIREEIDGVEFLWLWTYPYQRNDWRRGLNWLSFTRSLRNAARSRTWDVVIGSSPHLFAAATAQRVADGQGVPFVFEVRDLWPESLVAAGGRRGAMYFIMKRLADRLYARARKVIVLASGTASYLAGRGIPAGKLELIPNGVDPEAFAPAERSARPRTRFIYAGAHGPANGLDLVLEAAALLGHRDDIAFLLVGDGPAKPGLVKLAGSLDLQNVSFEAPVPKSEVPALLADADVGLMVLRDAELFSYGVSPNKLFDYFAAGLPVVCNVRGEVAGLVEAAGAGALASPGDPAALAAAIERMADAGSTERSYMGRSARAWVERERSRKVLGGRLDSVLRQMIGR